MTAWESHYQACEDVAFGDFLVEAVAGCFGCRPEIRDINRSVYKWTACGAWIRFDERGVLVGTIVEGNDAEYSQRIEVADLADMEQEESEQTLSLRLFAALENCEDFAEEHFPYDDWEVPENNPDGT
jgi:hypothetical protein